MSRATPTPPPTGSIAVVIGARGGIGAALVEALRAQGHYATIVPLSRPAIDLTDEASIAATARALPEGELRLVLDATGFLHDADQRPERSLRDLDAAALARNFALNAIGPALLMKHFLPLLPREGKAVFATLSARVGSIGDNRLGGWYGYRASKAALNQLVRTAAIELARTRPHAICVALHPGTVATSLSAPFAKAGLDVRPPDTAAAELLEVIETLTAAQTGSFLDWRGDTVPW